MAVLLVVLVVLLLLLLPTTTTTTTSVFPIRVATTILLLLLLLITIRIIIVIVIVIALATAAAAATTMDHDHPPFYITPYSIVWYGMVKVAATTAINNRLLLLRFEDHPLRSILHGLVVIVIVIVIVAKSGTNAHPVRTPSNKNQHARRTGPSITSHHITSHNSHTVHGPSLGAERAHAI